MTKETKPEGQYSKVSQVQFEKVQRKMANGMVQLLLQVLMAKLKMNDGIWDKKYEIKRLILSMNVNFYYLIIANWYFFFMVSKIICRAHLFLKNQQKCDILGKNLQTYSQFAFRIMFFFHFWKVDYKKFENMVCFFQMYSKFAFKVLCPWVQLSNF